MLVRLWWWIVYSWPDVVVNTLVGETENSGTSVKAKVCVTGFAHDECGQTHQNHHHLLRHSLHLRRNSHGVERSPHEDVKNWTGHDESGTHRYARHVALDVRNHDCSDATVG